MGNHASFPTHASIFSASPPFLLVGPVCFIQRRLSLVHFSLRGHRLQACFNPTLRRYRISPQQRQQPLPLQELHLNREKYIFIHIYNKGEWPVAYHGFYSQQLCFAHLILTAQLGRTRGGNHFHLIIIVRQEHGLRKPAIVEIVPCFSIRSGRDWKQIKVSPY